MNDIALHGPASTAESIDRPLTVVIADDQALVRGGFRLILRAAGFDVVAEAADGEQAVTAVLRHRPDVVLMDIRMPRLDGIEATRRILASRHGGISPADAAPGEASSATAWAGDGGLADSVPGAAGPDHAGPRIIILTTFDLDQYVYAALSAGASGFLLKDVTPEHLVAAVKLVQTGDALLAPSITRRLVERFAPRNVHSAPSTPGRLGSSVGSASAMGSAASGAPGPEGSAGDARTWRPGRPGCDATALTPRELEVLGLVARGMSNAEIAATLVLSEATVKTHVARILTKLGLRDRVQAVVLAYETGLIAPGGISPH